MKTTVDKFGRIVIPKETRDRLGFDPGTEMEIIEEGDSVRLRRKFPRANLVWKGDILVHTGEVQEEGRDIVKFLEKLRRERDEDFFPKNQ